MVTYKGEESASARLPNTYTTCVYVLLTFSVTVIQHLPATSHACPCMRAPRWCRSAPQHVAATLSPKLSARTSGPSVHPGAPPHAAPKLHCLAQVPCRGSLGHGPLTPGKAATDGSTSLRHHQKMAACEWRGGTCRSGQIAKDQTVSLSNTALHARRVSCPGGGCGADPEMDLAGNCASCVSTSAADPSGRGASTHRNLWEQLCAGCAKNLQRVQRA